MHTSITLSGSLPFIIAGPCVIESEAHTLHMAVLLESLVRAEGYRYIFKSSYDKANRTSIHSFRGPGIDQGLRILEKVHREVGCPILTDVHSVEQIAPAAEVVNIIQIPAFLCRQTDLYIEAGKYDVAVNVKKGQFMSPESMINIVEKARECGIRELTLTERGVSFGYERLVVDFTGIQIMREMGVPVIFDATHSVQQPGGEGYRSGGNRNFVPGLCRAAAANGIDGLFLEVHQCPDSAPCDGPNMIMPDSLTGILKEVKAIIQAMKEMTHEQR
ncbi:3-deoxy-8-phosphooctulonate synthase [bacterium]|nr:3-deoxy-8-phosphooctulonate synthase [candidate division CSSED10-310 bacterium]